MVTCKRDDLMMVLAGSRAPQADTATGGRGALPVQPHGLFHCFFRATPARVPSCLRRGSAVDNCFDASGTLRSRRGPPSGGGILDHKPKGACTPAIPLFSTSRIVAGAPLEGGIFKCARGHGIDRRDL